MAERHHDVNEAISELVHQRHVRRARSLRGTSFIYMSIGVEVLADTARPGELLVDAVRALRDKLAEAGAEAEGAELHLLMIAESGESETGGD